MIHYLYIFHKSGLNLTSVKLSARELKVSPDLVSGFLSALRMFGLDLLSDDITSIETGSYQFTWDEADPVLCVALLDREDDEVAALAVLKTLNALFHERFKQNLQRWTGEVASFRAFNPVVKEVIQDYLPSFEKPPSDEDLHPAALQLWDQFGTGLDIIIFGLLASVPLLVIGQKARNQRVIRALRTLQRRRLPVMWFDDAGAALQVLRDQSSSLSFILSLPPKAYKSTFEKKEHKDLTYVGIFVDEKKVRAIGFSPGSLGIAATIGKATESVTREEGKLVAESAFQTLCSRVTEVAQFLAVTPNLPESQAAKLLRLSQKDYRILKDLAHRGGHIQRAKRAIKRKRG